MFHYQNKLKALLKKANQFRQKNQYCQVSKRAWEAHKLLKAKKNKVDRMMTQLT